MANTISDITFVVTLSIDFPERKHNYEKHKEHWKDVNVIYEIAEPTEIFHRTKLFNNGLKKVKTKLAAIADIDCIFSYEVLEKAVQRCKDKTFVIPFNKVHHLNNSGDIVTTWKSPPKLNKETLDKHFYTGQFNTFIDYSNIKIPSFEAPTGLCGIVNVDEYRECGFENENCIDYAFEDIERIVRMKKFGIDTVWLDEVGYHLWHPNSSRKRNKLFRNNFYEFLKICDMSEDELRTYVRTWN
jgi:hypothetical protein